MNEVKWSRRAMKQAGRLHGLDRVKVFQAVTTLSKMPGVKNVKALKNHLYGYRLRVGNYRVLFDWDGAIKVVSIEEVRKRDERTY
ncbi:hypothetical protein A167_03133 [Alcanivorax sp. S71-1-4]|uniref:type II toxin-antitoxin system RelE family toxin n=1 Tax=Alcanivorax sp. S71-1-4 TaxID=1177159 RepID=UPI00135B64B0|nr:type II toxin-antitoxin system RelE/ParE family toxin [Alcanivorax sp. S71-1-4]KAF0806804.1 hypothetical protein A167_03133 [Alcanivorax sp. S71-1-4]